MKKQMHRLLSLMLSLILVVGLIPGTMTAYAADDHEHTYSEDWTRDTFYHWREATCEHSNEKTDYEMHTLVEGKCKCGLEHIHDWDTAWSYTDYEHWHNCKDNSCPVYYPKDKDGWGEHTIGADGKCSVCGKAPYNVVVIDGTSEKASYAPGEIVTITAYDYWGKQFAKWITEDGVTFADEFAKTTTFVMPDKNVRIQAVYGETYQVTVVGGTANTSSAVEGETITIKANEPGSNQKFVGWTVTSDKDVVLENVSAAETTFTMPNGNVMVKANFEEIESYHVTVVGGTADKETAGENKYKAEPGETIKITAYAPGSNQKFVGWEVTVNDMFVDVELADKTAAETTFTMPNGNVRVDAVFEEIESYHVTVVGGTADKETAGENKYKAEPGETIKITAYAPGSNQKFVGWEVTVNDMFVAVELADKTAAETTFTMPNGNVRVDAVFEDVIPSTYKVQVVGGTADKTEYAPGETVTITAYEPASDKQFAKWTTEDGVTFADATKATTTFVMPAKNVRVDATYEDKIPDKYSVQVVGGTADKTEYAPGETVTITAYPPASDKQFAKWTTEDGVTFADATKSTTTFVMPAKDVRVDATYEDEVPAGELDDVPKTGDSADLLLWGTLFMTSAFAVAVLSVLKKKRIF